VALLISILGFLFTFSLIIIVHEFGHFISAKKSGVKVLEFAFGFPPRLWSKVRGDTRYSINLIPMGGFVKLHGQDGSEEDKDDPTSYASKPAYIKVIILLSGVLLNFVLAWFILFGGYLFGMQPLLPSMAEHEGVRNNLKVVISSVEKGTPAEKVGIKENDILLSVDGKKINNSSVIIAYLQEKTDKANGEGVSVNAVVESGGKTQEKTVTTYKSKQKVGEKEVDINRIGVVLENQGNISAPLFVAMRASLQEVVDIMYQTLKGVFSLFENLLFKLEVSDDVTGPVGLVVITSSFAQMGFPTLIQFAAILSIAVGIFNILPIPGLDGGHTLVVLIESAFKKKFSNKTKNILQFVGFGTLILLMVVVTFKDIFRFVIIK